jgi:uncharacterized protein (UPF0332 family)
MDEHTRVLIQVRLEKCREDLESARLLLEHGLFRAAVNRAYYAVFHVATAALLTVDVIRSKHSGVQSAFAQYLVKPGIVEPEFYETLKFARELREESDYRDDLLTLTFQETTSLLESAQRFVDRVESYLEQVGALEMVGDKGDPE